MKKTKAPKRIPYKSTWTRGIDPVVTITLETSCYPNTPIEDANTIDVMQYLRRNGWTKVT